ncbi:hypothetical protein [Streptomyces sp. NPDC096339]|uniref:hypothetical protein n=1 Tax=Streptomyces sp. NPDC096339 TaxID=3366086 RepID=UPI0038204B24
MTLRKKTVALTVVGVAAGVAAFVAASERDRAAAERHLGWGSSDSNTCDSSGSCGTESSCGTAARGNGL